MSLVPILYTALLLFAVLSVVVITLSYISYKVKQRVKRRDEEEQHSYSYYKSTYQPAGSSNRTALQSAPAKKNSIKVVSTIKRPDLRKTVELPYYRNERSAERIPRSVPDYRSWKLTEERRQTQVNSEENEEFENKQIKRNADYNPRTRSGHQQERIEILNNNISRDEEPTERYQSSGSGSIVLPKYFAGFQAISYYSEEDDELFFKPTRDFE